MVRKENSTYKKQKQIAAYVPPPLPHTFPYLMNSRKCKQIYSTTPFTNGKPFAENFPIQPDYEVFFTADICHKLRKIICTQNIIPQLSSDYEPLASQIPYLVHVHLMRFCCCRKHTFDTHTHIVNISVPFISFCYLCLFLFPFLILSVHSAQYINVYVVTSNQCHHYSIAFFLSFFFFCSNEMRIYFLFHLVRFMLS